MSFTPAGHQAYPMQYMPSPYYYRPPMSPKRMLTVAAGVLIVIAGSICLLMAIIYIVDLAYWWGDDWAERYDWTIASFGFFGIVAFSMGIVAAIACFRQRNIYLAMLGESLVLISGGIDLFYTVIFGIILIVLALLSLIFTFASYEEFKARMGGAQYPAGPYPVAPAGLPTPPGQPPLAPTQPREPPGEVPTTVDDDWERVVPFDRDRG
jgi:hypothetical protein